MSSGPGLPTLRRRQQRVLAVAACCAGLALSSPAGQPAVAATPDTAGPAVRDLLSFVGAQGGGASAVDVAGSRAYVGEGYRLVALDLTGGGHPRLIARGPLLGDRVTGVAAFEDVVVVAAGSSGLRLYDTRSPAAPLRAMAQLTTGGTVEELRRHGDLVLAVVAGVGLLVLDASPDKGLVELGRLSLPLADAHVAAAGHLAVLTHRTGTEVVDLADPRRPTTLAHVELRGADDVAVLGNTAYLVTSVVFRGESTTYSGLSILDLADPAVPTLQLNVAMIGAGARLAAAGDRLYAFATTNGNISRGHLWAFDLADRLKPRELLSTGMDRAPDAVQQLLWAGSRLYLPAVGSGLFVVDPAAAVGPRVAGIWYSLRPDALTFVGPLLAAASGLNLVLLDVSDPTTPRELGRTTLPVPVQRLVAVGTRLYGVAARQLVVVDATLPNTPRLLGQLAVTDGSGYHIAEHGDFVYWAFQTDQQLKQLLVVDARDPEQLRVVARLDERAVAVATTGDILVTATDKGLMSTWDLTTPDQPRRLALRAVGQDRSLAGDERSWGELIITAGYVVWVAGKHIYTLDIADPAGPVVVGDYFHPARTLYGATLCGDRLYGLSYQLMVLPVWPWGVSERVASFEQAASAAACRDGHLYLGTDTSGLMVLRHSRLPAVSARLWLPAVLRNKAASGPPAPTPDPERLHVAYRVPAVTQGNQPHQGGLGLDFDVRAAIRVTAIGVFDDGQNGLERPITATLWERRTGTVVYRTTLHHEDGDLVEGSRFLPLDPPLELPAGFQGSIGAEGYGEGERNGNSLGDPPPWTTDDGGGLLDFVGRSRWDWPGIEGQFPTIEDGGPVNRYAAGTFQYHGLP